MSGFTQRREGAKKILFTRRRGDAEKKDLCRDSGPIFQSLAGCNGFGKAADAARQNDTSASPRLRVNPSSSFCAFAPSRESI